MPLPMAPDRRLVPMRVGRRVATAAHCSISRSHVLQARRHPLLLPRRLLQPIRMVLPIRLALPMHWQARPLAQRDWNDLSAGIGNNLFC